MKKILTVILLLSLFMVGIVDVNATSGKLRSSSIKTCNGVTYGQHGSDNHWHVAVKRDSGYYPDGSAIYSDPCSSGSSNIREPSSNVNSSNIDGSSNSDNSYNNDNSNFNDNSSNTENSSNTGDFSNTGNSNITENSSTSSDSTNASSSYNITNENSLPKEETKNNDNTLKTIIIDEKEIEINDNMDYSTTKEKVSIKVITNDNKATYEIKNNDNLSIGDNPIIIEVKAEDGTIKNYNININREIILSSDTNIKVVIDDKKVVFENYKATVYVNSSTSSINLDYTLNDDRSKVEMDKLNFLKAGDNILKMKVIAEDGTEQEYEIIIHKYLQSEEAIYTIISLGIFGGIGYGIYYITKKIKPKKNVVQ